MSCNPPFWYRNTKYFSLSSASLYTFPCYEISRFRSTYKGYGRKTDFNHYLFLSSTDSQGSWSSEELQFFESNSNPCPDWYGVDISFWNSLLMYYIRNKRGKNYLVSIQMLVLQRKWRKTIVRYGTISNESVHAHNNSRLDTFAWGYFFGWKHM